MGHERDLDVHETDYVTGESDGPNEDSEVHASTLGFDAAELAAPATRRVSEPLPDVRSTLRSNEEVERDRASLVYRPPVRLIGALVGVSAMWFAFQLLVVLIAAFLITRPATESSPDDVGGVPLRQHLGDR